MCDQSVLPVMSKIFEHLIHQQLTVHLEKILHNSVFGYRRYHGCLTALLALTEQWKEDLDNHNIISTAAIDLSEAFDCLSHDLIQQKLKFYGLGDHCAIFNAKLSPFSPSKSEARYCLLHVGRVLRGVPQGSVLGRTLLNIFINDLAYAITQCRIINYADDTNIHCSNKNVRAVEDNLNSDLANVTTWFIQNGMKLNPE